MRDKVKKAALAVAALAILAVGSAAPAQASAPTGWNVRCVGGRGIFPQARSPQELQALVRKCVSLGGHPVVSPVREGH